MNPVDDLFQKLRAQQRKAFIPFVTAGDPDLDTTAQLVQELVRRDCSLIEIGFPYSDPIADGSVIQASYTRALSRGIRIDEIFTCVKQLSESAPILGRLVQANQRGGYALLQLELVEFPQAFTSVKMSVNVQNLIASGLVDEELFLATLIVVCIHVSVGVLIGLQWIEPCHEVC